MMKCAQSFLSRLLRARLSSSDWASTPPSFALRLFAGNCQPPNHCKLVAVFGVTEFSCWGIHHKVYADRIHNNRNKDKRVCHIFCTDFLCSSAHHTNQRLHFRTLQFGSCGRWIVRYSFHWLRCWCCVEVMWATDRAPSWNCASIHYSMQSLQLIHTRTLSLCVSASTYKAI